MMMVPSLVTVLTAVIVVGLPPVDLSLVVLAGSCLVGQQAFETWAMGTTQDPSRSVERRWPGRFEQARRVRTVVECVSGADVDDVEVFVDFSLVVSNVEDVVEGVVVVEEVVVTESCRVSVSVSVLV